MVAAIGLFLAAATCWIAFALLLSVVISRVFVDGGALGSVDALLLGMLGLVVVRGVLLWGGEVVAQRAASRIVTDLRERLAAAIVALGPTAVRGERIGELVYMAGEGIESLDPYVTRYVPARTLAVLVPILVAIVVAALDSWSVVILLIAGPMLVLLLGLIGRRVRDLAERRERELAWMNAHFLDVLRGLPTVKMFGRGAEQAAIIRAVSRRQGSSTMDVLRTAFQTTLVLEWAPRPPPRSSLSRPACGSWPAGSPSSARSRCCSSRPSSSCRSAVCPPSTTSGVRPRPPPNASTPSSTHPSGSTSRRPAPAERCRSGWTSGSTTSS